MRWRGTRFDLAARPGRRRGSVEASAMGMVAVVVAVVVLVVVVVAGWCGCRGGRWGGRECCGGGT